MTSARAVSKTVLSVSRFFPDERHPEPRLSLGDIQDLSSAPSAFYASLVQALARELAGEFNLRPAAAATLAREPAVILSHIFLDRFLRLHRMIERDGASHLAVAQTPPFQPPPQIERLSAAASSSSQFNADMIARVASIWELESLPDPEPAPPSPPARPIANLNFILDPELARRLRWKLSRVSSRLWGRVPALGLAYAEWCFLDRGLVGPGRLADLHRVLEQAVKTPDAALRRRRLIPAIQETAPSLGALMHRWGLPAERVDRAIRCYEEYFCRFYPSSRLEDIPVHFPYALERLRPYAPKPLLLSIVGDTHTAYMLAAAKALGMPVIGVQHGAHYGFAGHACYLELEMAHFDRFVSWGPGRLPQHPLCQNIPVTPLPSPWLSERRLWWRRELRRREQPEFDALLVTDRLQRFPPALNTLRLSRIDLLEHAAAWLDETASALADKGLSMLHKPFNALSAELIQSTIDRLRSRLGAGYRVWERLDKGLSPELIRKGRLVIWDEPGTGLFECMAAGIPTLLYWKRDVSREEPYAEGLFAELEKAGIAHRDPASLAAAAASIKASAESWLADPARQAAIEKACRDYARVSDDWPREWRAFLAAL
ncbi:MAG: hypothetical protein HY549_01995 [Elusimicrobia bacterium]|nr:hypothetical protein [Elusimicrobiota bacterium]